MKKDNWVTANLPFATNELTNDQATNMLLSHAFGRLACTDGRQPYIVPVTYAYDGEYLYGQTNEGTKLNLLRKNPNVCFEVDQMTDMRNWKSVIIYGKFEELKGEEAENARAIFLKTVFPLMTNYSVHGFEHEVTSGIDDSKRIKFVMYRIKIEKITSRFEKQ
jgi:uncharacterized protein